MGSLVCVGQSGSSGGVGGGSQNTNYEAVLVLPCTVVSLCDMCTLSLYRCMQCFSSVKERQSDVRG